MAKETKTIHEKLSVIQSTLKAPKDLRNNFGNYNYRSAESILEAVKPILATNDCYINVSDELIYLGDRFYVKATATITDFTGSSVQSTALAREEESKKGMDGAQVTGAASSYARKYALNGLLAIDDTKDADATNTHDKETTTTAKPVEQVAPTKVASATATVQTNVGKGIGAVGSTTSSVMQPNTKFDKNEVDPAKVKALEMFNALDKPTVLKYLIKDAKMRYTKIEDFVEAEPIEKIREIYTKLTVK